MTEPRPRFYDRTIDLAVRLECTHSRRARKLPSQCPALAIFDSLRNGLVPARTGSSLTLRCLAFSLVHFLPKAAKGTGVAGHHVHTFPISARLKSFDPVNFCCGNSLRSFFVIFYARALSQDLRPLCPPPLLPLRSTVQLVLCSLVLSFGCPQSFSFHKGPHLQHALL